MPEPFAYHSVVQALEGQSGWTAERRFASAVLHAIDGHVPHARFVAAGMACLRQGVSNATVACRVHDWVAVDVNPLVVWLGSFHSPDSTRAAFDAYRAACGGAGGVPVPPLPRPCLAGIEALADAVAGRSRLAPLRSVTALAARLQLEGSAAAEVAHVFEREGSMTVAEVASRLGCQRRTLERQLQRMGVSAETIRQACRLLQATVQLGDAGSLTRIAIHAGYADTPHMTRAFRRAAGLPPSVLRRLLHKDGQRAA